MTMCPSDHYPQPRHLTREDALDMARKLICEDRAAVYGDAETMFSAIAQRWGDGQEPWQVAVNMADLKLARIQLGAAEGRLDSLLDGIAYLALAVELMRLPRPSEGAGT